MSCDASWLLNFTSSVVPTLQQISNAEFSEPTIVVRLLRLLSSWGMVIVMQRANSDAELSRNYNPPWNDYLISLVWD
jgi:hypothetical protein